MSAASNLERKRYNLMRLKQQQAEKKLEEEQKAKRLNESSRESEIDSGSGRKKSSEKLICRSQSSMSSTSNTDEVDLDLDKDLDVEEGAWYDVFRDSPSLTPQAEHSHTPSPRTNKTTTYTTTAIRRSTSKSPCPSADVNSLIKDDVNMDNVKHIERIRRKLSVTTGSTTLPLQTNTYQSKNKDKHKTQHEAEKSPNLPDTIFSTLDIQQSPTHISPKSKSQAVNLISLKDSAAITQPKVMERVGRSGSCGSVGSSEGSRPPSDSFKELRLRIDDQLFHS